MYDRIFLIVKSHQLGNIDRDYVKIYMIKKNLSLISNSNELVKEGGNPDAYLIF